MNKIEELIEQLCPEGVGFETLGKVCNIKTGQSVSKVDIQRNPGNFPVINSGKEPLGFIDKYNTDNDPIGITSRGAGVGSITWCEGKYFRGNLNYSVSIRNNKQILIRFLYFVLLNCQSDIQQLCSYNGIPALNTSNLKKLKIPIPPLPIQEEIVAILDKFTQLEAELEAELEARKKQYEYYREKLLTFPELRMEKGEGRVEWKTLGEVANIKNGKDWKKYASGDIPVYGTGGIMGYINKYAYDKETVLIPRKGTISNIFYLDRPFWNVDTIYYTEINSEILCPKFFFYYMKTIDLMKYDTGSGRPSLTQAILNKIKIPIPPLAEQERIVTILDKFDALVNDISVGLPAEIKARRKQYEHYREKLLTFEEKKLSHTKT